MKHLRYDLIWAMAYGVEQGHPITVMRGLGITYQHATPQSMGDQWWFWNCENIPDPLPPFLEDLVVDPLRMVGWGLTQQQAEAIRG